MMPNTDTPAAVTPAKKRLALYVYWDGQKEAKAYALFYVQKLKEVADRVLVIVNGALSDTGIRKFKSLGAEVLLRDNSGFDFAGWQAGFKHVGWDEAVKYDEVILCNSSCYGPVGGSFEPMFSEMDQRIAAKKTAGEDIDFWGVTAHPKLGRRIPWHIQSYFIVFNRRMVSYSEFRNFWDKLPIFKTWHQAVLKGEAKLTQICQVMGFNAASLIDEKQFEGRFPNPTIMYPVETLRQGSPLVKKKVFTESYDEFYSATTGNVAVRTMEYLKAHNFPVSDILEDMLKTLPPSGIRKSLHLDFILPEARFLSSDHDALSKTSLIFFAYYKDLVEECCRYIEAMPEECAVYVVSSKEDLLEKYRERLKNLKVRKLDFRLQPNRGRNESSYFTTCADAWEGSEYLCLAHDKKTSNVKPGIKGEHYMAHCMDNVLFSKEYVANVVDTFEKNPCMGLLEPPPPLFSAWDDTLGNLWGRNEKVAKEFIKNIPGDCKWDPRPIAPFGGMMWVRKEALYSLVKHFKTYEDYPAEPLPIDGSLLHALERLYPTVAQKAGYFTGWIMTEDYSRIYIDNLYHQLECVYGSYGIGRNIKTFVKRLLRDDPTLYEIAREVRNYFR
jgi:rhamnosyltransferase